MRRGIEQGEYVYRRRDLLFGPGDPPAVIEIDEQSMLFTMAYAKNTGIWPRQSVEPPAPQPTVSVQDRVSEPASDGYGPAPGTPHAAGAGPSSALYP